MRTLRPLIAATLVVGLFATASATVATSPRATAGLLPSAATTAAAPPVADSAPPLAPDPAAVPLAAATAAPAAGFTGKWAGYHTYAGMVTDIRAVAKNHPDIVRIFSIGKSYQGRDLWAAKVTQHPDAPDTSENKPEVMFDGLHHAREHLSLEQTLAIFHWLANGYATNTSVRQMVNTRIIWIVFAVNPDGAEYDLSGSAYGPFRGWRKNVQPIPGSRSIGIDLNRNYGYRFGCCGGSSSSPSNIEYRGPSAFYAPETRAIRDFVNSRVIAGHQRIRTAITFHAQGQLVLWPYGYTRKAVPADMTVDDQRGLSALGKAMAKTNGYTPEQSSYLYVTDGDEIDWMYGTYRIFVYTFEVYPTDKLVQGLARFYQPASIIPRETTRNLAAVGMLIRAAGCPYATAGLAVQDCGALYDDFEIDRGWKVNPDGTDTATSGAWQRARPSLTRTSAGIMQPATVPSGSKALVTGAAAGATPQADDLDGRSTIESPAVTLPVGMGQRLTFRYDFAHDAASTSADYLKVSVVGASRTVTALLVKGAPSKRTSAWRNASFSLDAFAGQTVRILITAADGGRDNLVEALVDDVRITRPN